MEHVIKLCERGRVYEALETALLMDRQGISLNRNISYFLLRSCDKTKDLKLVTVLKGLISANGLESIAVLGDHLIRLFACSGCVFEANQSFSKITQPSIYTWNAIILANVKHGEGQAALDLYHRMQFSGLHNGNRYVYLSVLQACNLTTAFLQGRLVHEKIIAEGFLLDAVLGSTLIDMYARCGSLEEACKAFEKSPSRDVISWGTMITGYAQHGECLLALECLERMQQEGIQPNVVSWMAMIAGYIQNGDGVRALEYFEQMQCKGIKPNDVAFLTALKACALTGDIKQGRIIHGQVMKLGFLYVAVGSSLIDMYAKCGSLVEAGKVFSELGDHDLVSWNTMIAGYAQHGEGLLALQCLQKMKDDNLEPSESSYTGILTACSRIGLVDEGYWYFKFMNEYHDIAPNTLHNACVVDLLGHAGHFTEAERLLGFTVEANVVGWIALLGSCKMHGNVASAKICFDHILSSEHPAGYVLLSNIYAYVQMPLDSEQMFVCLEEE